MKQITALSILLLSGLISQAQVTKEHIKEQAIIIGNGAITPEVKDGLYSAYLSTGGNQIALVAGQAFTSTYYKVENPKNGLIKAGKFTKRHAGGYDIIDLGGKPEDYRITLSATPLIVNHH